MVTIPLLNVIGVSFKVASLFKSKEYKVGLFLYDVKFPPIKYLSPLSDIVRIELLNPVPILNVVSFEPSELSLIK